MAIDWLRVRSDPIEAIEHGVNENSDLFETIYTGPITEDAMRYPVAEVLPENTSRADGNEFDHQIRVNLYFERGRDMDYVEDILHPVAGVVDECLAALSATPSVVTYVPGLIEDYAGELDNTYILLVSIRFDVTTLVDLAET